MAYQKVVGNDIETPFGSRSESLTRARGFLTENWNLGQGNATGGAATDGTVFVAAIGVKPGDVINNIFLDIETAGTGSGCTLAMACLYDRTGARLAVTADSAADRTKTESVGIKSFALTSAYTVGSNTDALYVGFVNKNGTTVCNLIVSGTSDVSAGDAVTGKFRAFGTGGTSQTSTPASATIVATSGINFWAALS